MEPVPSRITVTTGNQETVQSTIDRFFSETRRELERILALRESPDPFQLRSGELAYRPDQLSNDRVTTLVYKDQVIATVIETRTEGNHVAYTFFQDLRNVE